MSTGSEQKSDGDLISVLAWPAFSQREFNRYTTLLYEHLESINVRVVEFNTKAMVKGQFDVLHMHWPEWTIVNVGPLLALAKTIRLAIALSYLRIRGKKIVWTVHNDEPHSRHSALAARLLYRILGRSVDLQVHLTDATQQVLDGTRHPARDVAHVVISHGLLDTEDDYPTKKSARRQIGLPEDAEVLAFVGGVDHYKGVGDLIGAFKDLGGTKRRLVIAGNPSSLGLEAEIRKVAATDPRVLLSLEFLSDDRMRTIVSAADRVVLPYKQVLNSGSVFTSLAGHRPLLLPAFPTFEALQRQFGSEWIELFDSPLRTSDLNRDWTQMRPGAGPDLSALDWTLIARKTRDAYREVLGRPYGCLVTADGAPPAEKKRPEISGGMD